MIDCETGFNVLMISSDNFRKGKSRFLKNLNAV